MDEFGELPVESINNAQKRAAAPAGAGWHWALTLLSLALVTGLSFLMAFITKDVAERPIWLMGLIFMVPAGAMFLAAMIMEFSTGAMTSSLNRSTQVKIAALATAGTMLVGAVCDAIYLYGGFVQDCADNLLFLVYEEHVAGNSPTDQAVMQVLDDLHKRGGEDVQAGLFMFGFGERGGSGKNAMLPLAPFSQQHRQAMYNALIRGEKNQTVTYGHEHAYEMVENSGTTRPTRIIFICETPLTYGDGTYGQAEWDRDLARLQRDNISLYFMGQGEPDPGFYYMTDKSGGMVISQYDANSILDQLRVVTRVDGDMLRAKTNSATVLTGVMMLLEGLVIGLGLMLMLSVQGQKRFQVLLSPLMAALGFLILKILPVDMEQWLLEGAAFSLLGIVLMQRNYRRGSVPGTPAQPTITEESSVDLW